MANLPAKPLICLVIVSCFLFIFPLGCGDLDTELSSLIISPPSAAIGINQSRVFAVIAKDSLGFIVEIDPTWSLTGGIGSIGTTGLFTASSSAGSGTVVATYGETSASSTVTVTENGWLEGLIQSSSFGTQSSIKVYLNEAPTLSGLSDNDGRYSISNIPAGTYDARTEATNLFKESSMEVTIGKGETTTWDILLDTQPGAPVVPTTTLFVF